MKISSKAPPENNPEHSPRKRQKTLSPSTSREKILRDLEAMYEAALISKNYSVALRAIELRGKELGLFNEKKKEYQKSLDEMTEEELLALLNQSHSP
jgi:hypothetical protein